MKFEEKLHQGEFAISNPRFNGKIFATNLGRIYLVRSRSGKHRFGGGFLNQHNKKGILTVRFKFQGKMVVEQVGKLVLESFVCPGDCSVFTYKDGNQLNNNIYNLMWTFGKEKECLR